MDPPAPKHSITAENLANNNSTNTLKKISLSDQNKRHIIITECLCEPCPKFYTDTIFGSVLIECRDPRHDILHRYKLGDIKNERR